MEKSKYGTMKCIMFMLKTARRVAPVVLVLLIAQIVSGVLVHFANLLVTPVVVGAIERQLPINEIVFIITGAVLIMALVYGIQRYVKVNLLFGRVHVRVDLANGIHKKMCRTSFVHTESPEFLNMTSKASSATNSNSDATEAIWDTIAELLIQGICFIAFLIMLTRINVWILVFSAVTAIISHVIGSKIRMWRANHKDEESVLIKHYSYTFVTMRNPQLQQDIRLFGMRSWLFELHNKFLNLYSDFCTKSEKICLGADLIDLLLTLMRNGVAYAYLISITVSGELSAADFLLYFTALGSFTSWITGILGNVEVIRRQCRDISCLIEYLNCDEPFLFEDGEELKIKNNHAYSLELENVSFKYPEADNYTLKNISLKIAPEEKLAIVGLNGAGKTTLIKLLCGLYDPSEGRILLDGEDIKKYNRRDYYKLFSSVFQHSSLLAGTIAQNVAQASDDIDRERVKNCLKQAGLMDYVSSLSEGIDTLLDKNVYENATALSGGQMQRLYLARALYKNGPVLVLDEPTAALDPIAESDIYQRYNSMTKGQTSVFISHRLASTRFCDRIILLQDGVIKEVGTHDELMHLDGEYAYLFSVQSKYYTEGGNSDEED